VNGDGEASDRQPSEELVELCRRRRVVHPGGGAEEDLEPARAPGETGDGIRPPGARVEEDVDGGLVPRDRLPRIHPLDRVDRRALVRHVAHQRHAAQRGLHRARGDRLGARGAVRAPQVNVEVGRGRQDHRVADVVAGSSRAYTAHREDATVLGDRDLERLEPAPHESPAREDACRGLPDRFSGRAVASPHRGDHRFADAGGW